MTSDTTPETPGPLSSLETGRALIRQNAGTLAETPGVYRMLGDHDEVLYVGKARALKRRVLSYTQVDRLPVRLQRMVALTRRMEFVQTKTEVEALLLESNLIKTLKPRFNILLRDDKSFPYILLTGDHDFPQVLRHRGAKTRKGEYFGPFASAGAVNRTIQTLQRIFMLRNCTDSYFAARKRPCLQYHIKRCTAPCVGYVTKEAYAEQITLAMQFLSGESRMIQDVFAAEMQKASAAMDYETAAAFRDKIQALTYIQSGQDINMQGIKDMDVIALAREGSKSCIQVFFIRGGQNFGNHAYFPRHDEDRSDEAILAAFLAQFYENKPIPREIIISQTPEECELILEALTFRKGSALTINAPSRGNKARLMQFAMNNAKGALARHNAEHAGMHENLTRLQKLFGLEDTPERIEVYDNSHISGTQKVAAMIVAGAEGFNKSAYRKFNIKTTETGDDFAMMREAMQRRFTRAIKERDEDNNDENWPDLVLIDGGVGQLNAAREVLEELGLENEINLVAISKGPDRHAGREKFHRHGQPPFQLPERDAALHFLQRLRDEAHRFAIGAHRAKRTKAIADSPLEEVAGIGATRKKALLLHFGSGKAVTNASVEDLMKVSGISRAMAQKIYDHFH